MATPTRREFVLLCSGALVSLGTGLTLRAPRAGHPACHGAKARVIHPEPRPGITAAHVLTDDKLKDHPEALTAFQQVRQIPQIVDGIGCHCGCASRAGFYSLLSCYEGEGMAMMCEICQGQARLAYRQFKNGKTLTEVEEYNRGSAENPMSDAELRAKFDDNASAYLTAAQAANADTLMSLALESCDDH